MSSPITAAEVSDRFREPPERQLAAPVGTSAYRRFGTGPDVLFVHGWPVSGATFRCLIPSLAEHVTCHVLDLPGAGQSGFDDASELSIANHVEAVRRAVDELGLDSVALVGHDSGGMIARHAMAGDTRLRSMGLINTEMPDGNGWRFRSFLLTSRLPGFGRILGWAAGKPAIRRNKFVLGDAFADRSRLDGEFAEFFLDPLATDRRILTAAIALIDSFDPAMVTDLAELHTQIDVPVGLVWGDQDPFFPVANARQMVATFADASLVEIPGAGLFSHEEAPDAVAEALLTVLVR